MKGEWMVMWGRWLYVYAEWYNCDGRLTDALRNSREFSHERR
jgi:hypothetical protein